MRPLRDLVTRTLARPRFALAAAALGVVLGLPALGNGWALDDQHHRLAFLGRGELTYGNGAGLTDLFTFAEGGERTRRAIELGIVPWWTDAGVRLSFFRPLAAATHRLDYALWPDSAELMHAHSLVWYAAAILLAGRLYARFLGAGVAAGLAILLFAVDEAHGFPVGWLAQRNALVAFVFGMLAIGAHHRWRRSGARRDGVLSLVWLAAALLASEAGLGALAYLLAHAVCLDPGRPRARVAAVLPALGLIAVWRVATSWAGYGASGTDFYVDPGSDPLRFVAAVLERAPILLLGQWSPVPAAAAMLGVPGLADVLLAVGAGLVALLAVLFLPLLRRDRVARFFALGMLLAVIPICATYPHDRNLLFVGLGAFGLLTRFLGELGERIAAARLPARLALRASAVLLLAVHAVIAPLRLPREAKAGLHLAPAVLLELPEDAPLDRESVVVVNGPLAFAAMHLSVDRAVRGLSVPRHTRVLFPSLSAMRIERPDEHTLLLESATGWTASPIDTLYRTREKPLRPGDRVELPDLSIEVRTLTAEGRPASIACRFPVPLEHPSLRWVFWRDGRFEPFRPPAPGTRLDLPAPTLPL